MHMERLTFLTYRFWTPVSESTVTYTLSADTGSLIKASPLRIPENLWSNHRKFKETVVGKGRLPETPVPYYVKPLVGN